MIGRKAREQALCLVYAQMFSKQQYDELIENYVLANQQEIKPAAATLAEGVISFSEELDALVEKYAHGWKLTRIAKISLAIMRIAIYEMLYVPDLWISVSISEAVELAKKYATKEDKNYINGILGSIARQEKVVEPDEPLAEEFLSDKPLMRDILSDEHLVNDLLSDETWLDKPSSDESLVGDLLSEKLSDGGDVPDSGEA